MFFMDSPDSIDGGLDWAEKDLGRVSRSDQVAFLVWHNSARSGSWGAARAAGEGNSGQFLKVAVPASRRRGDRDLNYQPFAPWHLMKVVLGFNCTQRRLRLAAAPVVRLGLANAPFFPQSGAPSPGLACGRTSDHERQAQRSLRRAIRLFRQIG